MSIFSNLKGDFSGGLAASAITIPQCLGWGLIVFAPLGIEFASNSALIGIYSAVIAGAIAAVFGGNPIQITAPRASVTMILAAAISNIVGSQASSSRQS